MSQSSNRDRSGQIGKALYTIYAIGRTLASLPFHLLANLAPSLRPHPLWTYRQSLMNMLMRAFLYHASKLEMQTHLSLLAGKEGPNFVAIDAAKSDFYRGVLSPRSDTSPAVVGGIWYPSAHCGPKDKSSYTILYFHGGAFVIGTARPDVCSFAAQTLNEAFHPARTLAFSYRLASSGPSCAFPAAVQDALTAYLYLLAQDVPADRIIFAGDSTGCNIAIALLRYLGSPDGQQMHIPTPLAAVMCSPWVDVHATRMPSFADRYDSVRTDYVPAELQLWGARSYVPEISNDEINAYVSPLRHPFQTSAKIMVIVGGCEVLAPEGLQWAKEMSTSERRVEVEVANLANHAVLGVGGIMGFASEAERVTRKARHWILDE